MYAHEHTDPQEDRNTNGTVGGMLFTGNHRVMSTSNQGPVPNYASALWTQWQEVCFSLRQLALPHRGTLPALSSEGYSVT